MTTARLQDIHPVLMSLDVAQSAAFYQTLGFRMIFLDDPGAPRYAVIRRDDVELHLQWADAGQLPPGLDRPNYRLLAGDVDAVYAEFAAAGVIAAQQGDSPWAAPAQTPWGTREFHLRDPGGNGLQFYQPA